MRDFYFALASISLCCFMILQDTAVGLFLASFILLIIGLFYDKPETDEVTKYKNAYEALIAWTVENIEKDIDEFGEYPTDEEIEEFLSSIEDGFEGDDEDDEDDDFYTKFNRYKPSDN